MFSFKNIVELILDKYLVLLSVCVALCYTCRAEDAGMHGRYAFNGEKATNFLVDAADAFSRFRHILKDSYICMPSIGCNFHNVVTAPHLTGTCIGTLLYDSPYLSAHPLVQSGK